MGYGEIGQGQLRGWTASGEGQGGGRVASGPGQGQGPGDGRVGVGVSLSLRHARPNAEIRDAPLPASAATLMILSGRESRLAAGGGPGARKNPASFRASSGARPVAGGGRAV